jgi:hypothetical protein
MKTISAIPKPKDDRADDRVLEAITNIDTCTSTKPLPWERDLDRERKGIRERALVELASGLHTKLTLLKATSAPRAVPPMVEDKPGCSLKPDPSTATTLDELLGLLRELYEWSGQPGSRRVARGSDGAFSHTTAAKLLNGTGKIPPLKLEYVRGLVLGMGGTTDDVSRWATAWREITLNRRCSAAPLRAVNE